MTLRTSLSPLGGGNSQTGTAVRSPFKMRRLPVSGSEIVLRDYASVYSIDLSAVKGGTRSYTLDDSRIHEANHEVCSFELLVTMPAADPPAVTLEFVDKWLDFGLWFRREPGVTYAIACFRLGGKWYAAQAGTFRQPTIAPLLGRLAETESEIALADAVKVYRAEAAGATAFTFDASGLTAEKDVLSFELLLDVPEELPLAALTFPVSDWFDFCMPYRPWRAGTHSLTFLSLDGGTNWIGRYNSLIKEI